MCAPEIEQKGLRGTLIGFCFNLRQQARAHRFLKLHCDARALPSQYGVTHSLARTLFRTADEAPPAEQTSLPRVAESKT